MALRLLLLVAISAWRALCEPTNVPRQCDGRQHLPPFAILHGRNIHLFVSVPCNGRGSSASPVHREVMWMSEANRSRSFGPLARSVEYRRSTCRSRPGVEQSSKRSRATLATALQTASMTVAARWPHRRPFGNVHRKLHDRSRRTHPGERLWISVTLQAANAGLQPVVTVPRGMTATISGVSIAGGRVGVLGHRSRRRCPSPWSARILRRD